MVVNVHDLVCLCILLEHLVELHDLLSCISHLRSPSVSLCRNYRADYRLDLVSLCDFTHRDDVAEDVLERDITVVKGDIVGTGKDRDIFRMMVHNVSSETYEHL